MTTSDDTVKWKITFSDLSRRLRERDFPPHFFWNFVYCRGCAMGLVHRIVAGHSIGFTDRFQIEQDVRGMIIGADQMPPMVWCRIFWSASTYDVRADDVTPEMIADKLDAWLEHFC